MFNLFYNYMSEKFDISSRTFKNYTNAKIIKAFKY